MITRTYASPAPAGTEALSQEEPRRRSLFGRLWAVAAAVFASGSLRRALVVRIVFLGMAPVIILACVALYVSNNLLYARFSDEAHLIAAAAEADITEDEDAVTQLASLLAILPNMRNQVTAGDAQSLTASLISIKSRTKVELMDVADLNGQIVAGAQDLPKNAQLPDTLLLRAGASAQQAWAIYDEPEGIIIRAIALIRGVNSQPVGMMEVGELLGKASIDKVKAQSDSDLVLLWDGQVRLTSLDVGDTVFPSLAAVDATPDDELTTQLVINGKPYLGIFSIIRTHTDTPGVLGVLVPLAPILDANRTLIFVLVALGVVLGGGLVAVAYRSAGGITAPLRHLDEAARRIQQGDLSARVNAQSADEIRTLAQTFNTMAEALSERQEEMLRLDEMKTSFISNASHELRTPLSSIRSFSELLIDDVDMEPAIRAEFAGIINSEAERLSRLVNNLLDLSRMEAGAVEWRLAPLDLAAELHRVVLSQQPVAQQKDLDLRLDVPDDLDDVIADEDGLHQVMLNLIGNAIKFTEAGHVVVSAQARNGRVEVAVRDTGPGLSDEDSVRVFDRFYQAGNSLTEKPTGTGLGLAICQKILEQHGSRIHLSSKVGQGSRFSFDLEATPRRTPSRSDDLITTSMGGTK